MTEIASIDWFGRWGTSVFSENTAIFYYIPGIYAEGYLCRGVYSFRLSVCPLILLCSFIYSFVVPSVALVEFGAKFYTGGSAFIP